MQQRQHSQNFSIFSKLSHEKTSSQENVETVFLVIDINYDGLEKYNVLTEDQKIKLLSEKIEAAVKELRKTEPDALIVVTWREYGIEPSILTDQRKSVDATVKKAFKAKMKNLVQNLDNIMIMAGSILVRKKLTADKLMKLQDYYKKIIELAEETQDPLLKEQIKILEEAIAKNQDVMILSNKSYIFRKNKETGKVQVEASTKITPFNEQRGQHLGNQVYGPAEDAVYNPSKEEKAAHLLANGKYCYVIICFEHLFLQLIKKKNIPFAIIMSKPLETFLENLPAKRNITVDSQETIKHLVLSPLDLSDRSTRVYKVNLSPTSTVQSVPAYCPLLFSIENIVRTCINENKDIEAYEKEDLITVVAEELKISIPTVLSESKPVDYVNFLSSLKDISINKKSSYMINILHLILKQLREEILMIKFPEDKEAQLLKMLGMLEAKNNEELSSSINLSGLKI